MVLKPAKGQQMYTFKPFVFTRLESPSLQKPKARSGHRIVCDEVNVYSYGGFNPSITDDDMQYDTIWSNSRPLFKEVWKFNLLTHKWTCLPGQSEMPNELASNAVILKGTTLLIYGGTGVPFGASCSNQLYLCNIITGKIYTVPATGDFPDPQYGQAVVCYGPYLYTIGGTTGYEYTCDIHRFDLRTNVWESVYICGGKDQCEPQGRYRHEVAFYNKIIYVLGGGTAQDAFGFLEIPAFNVETNRWLVLNTKADKVHNTVPAARRCHGLVQYTDELTGVTYVVISGGYNGRQDFNDLWRLELSNLQWTCLKHCVLPRPVYFHSTALTPSGCMYTFGGIIKEDDEITRTDAVHSVWLTIPQLSEICWLALNYYWTGLKKLTSEELLSLGIPRKFVKRLEPKQSAIDINYNT